MKCLKKTNEYRIYKRNDGRHAVTTIKGKPINGDDKAAILLAEGLITAPLVKAEPKEEAPAEPEETSAEAVAETDSENEAESEEG